jgi:hypothetical protein
MIALRFVRNLLPAHVRPLTPAQLAALAAAERKPTAVAEMYAAAAGPTEYANEMARLAAADGTR